MLQIAGRRPAVDRKPSVTLLDVRIDRLLLPQLLGRVSGAVRDRARLTVLYVNVHCMNLAGRDPQYRSILNGADIVYCDGTGVRLGAFLAGRHIPARMTGADWIEDLCAMAAHHGYSLFLLGGDPGVASEAGARLAARHPGLRIEGTAAGFSVDQSIVQRISSSGADILLVGMGSPRQEKWIAEHRAALDVPVVWAVGALFDFVTGRIPRGPRWMTEHGLEWLCRLWVEPRKLWRRYLVGNPVFLWRVIRTYWLS